MTGRLVAAAAAAVVEMALALAVTGAARAQDPAPPVEAPAAERAVDITVVGKPADLDRLRALAGARTPGGASLRWGRVEHFDPLGDLLRAAPPDPSAALRCWVDMSEPRRVVLYFAARGGQRFLVRGVELSGRFDELDRQSLAQVLELSISALLESADVGITRSEARVLLSRAEPPPAPAVTAVAPPPPTPAPRVALSAAVSYGAQARGGGLPLGHGPGLDLAVRRTAGVPDAGGGRLAWGGWLTAQVQLPATARVADVGVELETLAARAGLELGRGRLRARAGAGVDWVWVSPQAVAGGGPITLAKAHRSSSFVASGAIAWRQPLGRGAEIGVTLSVDVLPTVVHFDVGTDPPGGAQTTAFDPWRVRPGLALQLGF